MSIIFSTLLHKTLDSLIITIVITLLSFYINLSTITLIISHSQIPCLFLAHTPLISTPGHFFPIRFFLPWLCLASSTIMFIFFFTYYLLILIFLSRPFISSPMIPLFPSLLHVARSKYSDLL